MNAVGYTQELGYYGIATLQDASNFVPLTLGSQATQRRLRIFLLGILCSDFDTFLRQKLRSVVAEDYFLKNSLLAWFSLNILNIISLKRHNLSHRENPLLSCSEALSQGDILIIYPEGTKGEPHSLALIWLKLTLIFLFMDGLRKLLPKGEILLVSFLYDIFVEENIDWTGIKKSFMDLLNQLIQNLASQGKFPSWE